MLSTGMIVLIVLLSLLGGLIIFMIARTALVKSPAPIESDYKTREVDADEVAEKLMGAVSIPTVTVIDEKKQSYQPFADYQAYLEKSFPLVFSKAEKFIVHEHSLVLKVQGSDPSLLPGGFGAHQDVVPAPVEDGWETDPFVAEKIDGYIYGRGSADMKHQMIANLQGLELLLKEGKEVKRTIYFCFGHDEEYTGRYGAKYIAEWLAENNIELEFFVDEGGTILDARPASIDGKVALIGLSEKGYADFKLTASIPGGHASSPAKRNSSDRISRAVYDLSHFPMKAYWSAPLKQTVKEATPYVKNFGIRFILANRDIFGLLLCKLGAKLHPIANSVFRTTMAVTQLEGSCAPNVIPKEASCVVNIRVNAGQTLDQVKKHIQKVVGKDITITEVTAPHEPSYISPVDTEIYSKLCSSITDVFEKHYPISYCFIAATDAKHYRNVCKNIYRFTPFEISVDDQHRIHAINERVRIDSLAKATEFFARFIEKSCM